jgi:hypothetical protein
MNYEKIYDSLIFSRQNRILPKNVYAEKHHIIMRSMGGKDTPDNIVILTAKEHFLAHLLLHRIHRNKKTSFALFAMCNFKNKSTQGKNRVFSAKSYEFAKNEFCKFLSDSQTGVKKSEKHCEAISRSKEIFWSKKTAEEKSATMKKVRDKMTSEQRKKRSQNANLSYTSERRSKNAHEIFKNLTDDQKTHRKKVASKVRKNFWQNLSPEEKILRMKKLNDAKKKKNEFC